MVMVMGMGMGIMIMIRISIQVMVGENMSSRELVWLLLSKYRMRHRDPKVIMRMIKIICFF